MRKERVEFSILQHKAAIRGSSVALTARTRNRISKGLVLSQKDISSDVDVIVYALDQSLPYGSLDRVHSDRIEVATKSFSSRAQIAHKSLANADSMILWADPIGNIDIKGLGSIGRGAQPYDPNAQDADGDGLVQDNTPWERPSVTQRAKRKIKKGKRRLANILEQGADKLDERQSRREQRGPLKERIAGRLDDVASRVEARKLKPKKPKKTRVMDYLGLSPTDKPSELPDEPRKPKAPEADIPEADIPEAVTPTPKTPEVAPEEPDAWAEAIDNWKKKPSGSAAAEDITATAVSEEKLPGKAFGTAHKDQNSALLGAKDASSKKKDVVFHVVKDEDGKMIVVDDERMKAMKAKPIASYKDGSMIMRDGAPVKKKKDSTNQKALDDAAGWSGGGKFANTDTAIDQARNINNTVYPDKDFEEGDHLHVVKLDNGFATLVDDEKLQALGIQPVASFDHKGNEVAWGMTDPVKKPKKESKPKPIGEIPGEPPMPTLDETLPKTEVVDDAKKKTPKLGGKQFGRPFKNEKSAAKRADELGVDGNKYHVVKTDQGFRIVDQDRLDAMGIKPIHTSGEKYFKPAPSFKPKEDSVPDVDKEVISFEKKKELDNAILTIGGTDVNNNDEAAKALAELDKINNELDGFTSDSQSEGLKNDLENVRNEILKKYPDAGKGGVVDKPAAWTGGPQEIPNLNDWPAIGEIPESSWDKLAADGDVATLKKAREAWKDMRESIGKEGPAVDWANKYINILDEKIKTAGANAQEGIKPKKQSKTPKISSTESSQIQFAMAVLNDKFDTPLSKWSDEDKEKFEAALENIGDVIDSYAPSKATELLKQELDKIDSKYAKYTEKVPTKKELDDALEAKLATLGDAELLNATMGGVYSDEDLNGYKKVFEKALAELESLTPEERKAFGAYNDYEDELVGIRNNIAILELTIGTGKDILDVANDFHKAELDKSKKTPEAGDVLESTGLPKRFTKEMTALETVAAKKFKDSVGANYEAYTNPDGTFNSKKWIADRKKAEKDYQASVAMYTAIPNQENLDKYLDAHARSLLLSNSFAKASKYFETKKSVAKNKPLGKDEIPAWSIYGGAGFQEPDLDSWLDGKGKELAEANGTSLREEAKTHFKGVESQIKEIADDLKAGGKYEGLDQNALLDVLSERSMESNDPIEKEASDILIGLLEREGLPDVTPKAVKNIAKTYGLAAKKKISSMQAEEAAKAVDKTDDAASELTMLDVFSPTGSALLKVDVAALDDFISNGEGTADEKITKLWDLKSSVDNYVSDLQIDGEQANAAKMQKLSDAIYGKIEDLSMSADAQKAEELQPQLDTIANSVAELIDRFQDSELATWSNLGIQTWLMEWNKLHDQLDGFDPDNVLGDLPQEQMDYLDAAMQDIINENNGLGADGFNLPEVVNGKWSAYKGGPKEDIATPNKPKSKMSLEEIQASYEANLAELNTKIKDAKLAGDDNAVLELGKQKESLYREKAVDELEHSLANPQKVSPDSPSPFKTSKAITEEDFKAIGVDNLYKELDKGRKDLVSFLFSKDLISKDLADEPEEIELPDGTKKEIWKAKVSDEEIRKAIISALTAKIETNGDIGEIAALKTHLHNFDVMSSMGAYSPDVSPGLTSFDQVTHLGPSAQKGIFKSLGETVDEDKLNGVLKKNAKKAAKKIAKEDIAKIVDKPDAPGLPVVATESLLSSSAAKVKAAGLPVWDDFVENAPKGAILEVVPNYEEESTKMNNGEKLPFKNVNAELIHLEGEDVGYWVDASFFRNDEKGKWIDESFPTAYKYPSSGGDDELLPGQKGGIIGGPSMKGDFTPSEGSPLAGKTSQSFGSLKEMLKEGDVIDPFSMLSYSIGDELPLSGSSEHSEIASGFRKKFGNVGGVLVKDDNGAYHYITKPQWNTLSDDEKSVLAVQMEVPKIWETWSGNKGGAVTKLPDDWETMDKADQGEMLSALLSQDALVMSGTAHEYSIQNLGLTGGTGMVIPIYPGANIDEKKQALKDFINTLADNENSALHGMAFTYYEISVGPEGNKAPAIVGLNSHTAQLADKHPELFKKIASYDGLGNYSDDFGVNDSEGTMQVLSVLNDPDSIDWMQSGDQSAMIALAQTWYNKLDGKGDDGVKAELDDATSRINAMRTQLEEILLKSGNAPLNLSDMSEESIRKAFDSADVDFDAFMSKLKTTSSRRQMTKSWQAAKAMASIDQDQILLETNKRIANGTYTTASQIKAAAGLAQAEMDKVEATLGKVTQIIATGEIPAGSSMDTVLYEYAQARTSLKGWTSVRDQINVKADAFATEKYAGKSPVQIGGEEFLPVTGSVYAEAGDMVSAMKVVSAISPLLKNEEQIGLYQLDSGKYAIVDMDKALSANMPAPEMIFTSHGQLGVVEADPTDMMDLMTSAGMPKVKEGYAGIENLGVSSDNGVAIGKYVPSPLPADATPEMIAKEAKVWGMHIANGGSLAEVPNDLLLEVVWQHREGGDGTGRFKFLTKASGYNDNVSDPKMRTHRFLDTTTGHTFVIKSATRNDQEGIRELFGNQVMQSLGFPSSGGRTASVEFVAPNKYASFNHPEANMETPQASVLLESSEMLYEGESLGHIKNLPYSERQDIIARLTPESVANGVVMDSLFRYYDRQEDNWIAIQNPDGSVSYHPIDHGNAFGKFKGKKFSDKNGVRTQDDSPGREDELGFMFTGLDGEGTWKLAKESMTTPERKARFAEGILRAVHRAETTDYQGEAEKLISGQNLSGELAERAKTSAKGLDEKKKRIGGYVDALLQDLGMSDEEIAGARAVVEAEISTGLLKAGKAVKPVTVPGVKQSTMTLPTPINGEAAFGNAPALPNAKTVTDCLVKSTDKPNSVHFASVGGGQVKGGVRFSAIETKDGTPTPTIMTLRVDEATIDGIMKSFSSGMDASGGEVELLSVGPGQKYLTSSKGKLARGPGSVDQVNLSQLIESVDTYEPGNSNIVVKTPEGHVIVVNQGRNGQGFSIGDTIQIIMNPNEDGTSRTPKEVESLMRSVGIKNTSYISDDGWKMQAAELLVRTYGGLGKAELEKPLVERLAGVAAKHGITVEDVEPYFASTGQMKFRLTQEAWDKIKADNPGFAESGNLIVKAISNTGGDVNVIRAIDSGGIQSKSEQVMNGFGVWGNEPVGGGGQGSGATSDLASGGGLGVFMTPIVNNPKSSHQSSQWGSRGTDFVFDGEAMMRDLGWWAHGPSDNTYGVINPKDSNHMSAVGDGETSVDNMLKQRVFEFLSDSSADMSQAKGVILSKTDGVARRQKLIDHYAAQGITEINGIPLEDFFIATGGQARKMVGPDFKGTSINGFKVYSKVDDVDKPQVVDPVAPGTKLIPSWLIKGKSSDAYYFPDGKLKKTKELKQAMARAAKYSKANPSANYYIFRDGAGNYRVAAQKFADIILKYNYQDALTHKYSGGVDTKEIEPV